MELEKKMDEVITAEEVQKVVKLLKNNKAHYLDNVDNEQLINGGGELFI